MDAKLKEKLDLYIRDTLYDEKLYSNSIFHINPFKGAKFSFSDKKLGELDRSINVPKETFVTTLLKFIDRSGMTDVEVYKKAQVDRKLFSRIKSDINYTPSKKTIFSFILALELDIDDAKDLLEKAGYTFSSVSKSDLIIRFCIEHGEYDINEINEVLFMYKQPLLG